MTERDLDLIEDPGERERVRAMRERRKQHPESLVAKLLIVLVIAIVLWVMGSGLVDVFTSMLNPNHYETADGPIGGPVGR
jgi:hypothetical protein